MENIEEKIFDEMLQLLYYIRIIVYEKNSNSNWQVTKFILIKIQRKIIYKI